MSIKMIDELQHLMLFACEEWEESYSELDELVKGLEAVEKYLRYLNDRSWKNPKIPKYVNDAMIAFMKQ